MPNFDGGHYFLTTLIPVRRGLMRDPINGGVISHLHALREVLASLPSQNESLARHYKTGLEDSLPQEQLSRELTTVTAPFSRDLRTHFARMVVIDDMAYNGRQHKDALLTSIFGPNPVLVEPVDHLPQSYMAMVIDFDANDGSAATLRGYLHGLWDVMDDELNAIFQHCDHFDSSNPEQSFVSLIENCQIETTMSYNDYYWTGQGQGSDLLWAGAGGPTSQLGPALLPPGLAFLALGLLGLWCGLRGWLLLLVAIAALVACLYWLYRRILTLGFAPFPTAPRSDLPSVLKALYLQRRFIRFMVEQQGQSPEALKAGFSDFLAEHQPSNVTAPTQLPAHLS
jgi:hypothetical protein